jgi:hypothetical protein
MLRLEMTAAEWTLYGNAPINRITFNEFITNYIAGYLKSYDDCQKTIVRLPETLTKNERYSIHRLSIHNSFDAMSYDVEDTRVMEITLSKNYILELFLGYEFANDTVADVPKTDKQKLFESMITFIHENLENEFNNYLNTI